jgi:hypothetical protein
MCEARSDAANIQRRRRGVHNQHEAEKDFGPERGT